MIQQTLVFYDTIRQELKSILGCDHEVVRKVEDRMTCLSVATANGVLQPQQTELEPSSGVIRS